MGGRGVVRSGDRGRASRHLIPLVVVAALLGVSAAAAPTAAAPAAAAAGSNLGVATFGALAVDPTSGRVFASGDDAVLAFAPDGSPAGAVREVYGARGMAFGVGSLWVAQTTAASIAEIDPATMHKVREHDAGGAVGADVVVVGRKVWFTQVGTPGTGGLRSLDPATGAMSAVGPWVGPALTEIPGSTTHLLAADPSGRGAVKVDVTTDPPTVVARAEEGTGLDAGAGIATSPSTMVAPIGGRLHGMVEVDLHPVGGVMERTGMAYPGVPYPSSPYPRALAYSPGNGGAVAATTVRGMKLLVARPGEPRWTHVIPLAGEPVGDGVALSASNHMAYVVAEDPVGGLRLDAHPLTPTITSISTRAVTRRLRTTITVDGSGLGSIRAVFLGGARVDFAPDGASRLEVEIVTDLEPGIHALTLAGPIGTVSGHLRVDPNPGRTLTGTITRDGIAVSGAPVAIIDEQGRRRTTTGPSGTYSFPALPFGRAYDLEVTDPARGTVISHDDLDLTAGTSSTVDVDLTSPPAPDSERRRTDLPPGEVRRLVVRQYDGRAFVAVGDEIVVFDRDGRLLRRIQQQWGVSDLQLVRDTLYAMQHGVGRVAEIDPDTLQVRDTIRLGTPTTGSFVVTGNWLRFADGDSQWTRLASIDLTTGASGTSGARVYSPRLAPIDGSTRFLSSEDGASPSTVSQWDGSSPEPTVVGSMLLDGAPADVVAQAQQGRAWTAEGAEIALATMTTTGVRYPSGGPAAARAPGHGGVIVLGDRISRQGRPVATHVLPSAPAARSVGIDEGGDLTFTATPDGALVIADLAPVLRAPADGTSGQVLTIPGEGLGAATDVLVDGAAVAFDVVDPSRVDITLPTLVDGPHHVVVRTPWGASRPQVMHVGPPRTPVLTSASRTSGGVLGGERMTLMGSNLARTTAVSF
ncbi:MAG TPA: carboxypeptidase-like regulatory domain-containing protein, partial [Aquihabitans sp.]|nr:carboxypeptidase-like regulatory domain-containing protein [Aquihabitans sp.]